MWNANMGGKGTISDYRNKMDKTLASPDLTNYEKLQTLVRNQILESSNSQLEEYVEHVVERRSKEVSNFLAMLRSTTLVNDADRSKSSELSHRGWKVKQDTEEFRVMYQEGPEGTPFHTLLVEGYVDGPLDVCLCISWESSLYSKWWPQTAVPTFKIISSRCLKRVGADEQISLVRMKVSWPLSSREALVHYFAFEYFQDDLMVVLVNSISDSETINRQTHGFTREGIPDAEDVVRIDLVGGFALQKVTADRSYFRTIANMDIKLDFVPPAFINFVSRQLVGSGFKLYKKEVASVSKGDQKFCEALKDSLYARIRAGLDSARFQNLETQDKSGENYAAEDEDSSVVKPEVEDAITRKINELTKAEELQENDDEGSETLDDCLTDQNTYSSGTNKEVFASCREKEQSPKSDETTESSRSKTEKKLPISPKVEKALETLENIISMFQEQRSNHEKNQSGIHGLTFTSLEREDVADQTTRNCAESSRIESLRLSSVEARRIGLDNHASRRETNHSKVAAAASPGKTQSSSKSGAMQPPVTVEIAGAKAGGGKKSKNKKFRLCCGRFM